MGRVIARPFDGEPGAFRRTTGRRDFALPPPGRSYLDEIQDAGVPVHAVGKVGQIFAGRGVTEDHHAPDNPSAIDAIDCLLAEPGPALVFANLVDTDQLYGHRKDVQGFHARLREIDVAVARWLVDIGEGDLLILCADHGCDPPTPAPTTPREHSPLLAMFAGPGRPPRRRRRWRRWARVRCTGSRAGGPRICRASRSCRTRKLPRVPELPEVETIRRHLAPHVEGRVIERLEVLDPRWCDPAPPEELAAAVEGRRIERLSRRGKYLDWELEDEVHVVMHLRMTGNILIVPAADDGAGPPAPARADGARLR